MSDWMTLIIVAAGLVYFMYWGDEQPVEERECGVCKKKTRWHPKHGCEECRWADRQWRSCWPS